jgi:carboxypeptidase C (cathepsin A)
LLALDRRGNSVLFRLFIRGDNLMTRASAFSAFLFSFVFLAASGAWGDLSSGDCTAAQTQTGLVTTEHMTSIGGKTIHYKASVGYIEVTSRDQTAKACIFYTSYVVPQADGAAPRPVLFAFNGGPGSASVWMHLGLLGPKRVDMGADGLHADGDHPLITNDFSLLDVSDIVLIDPVSTGFSHTVGDASNSEFFGVLNDYVSIEAFIQSYLNQNNRWASPKFVIGESYGGIRGSLLANHLQADLDIGLNGLILISPQLSDTSVDFSDPDNNTPYWTYFPTLATTAWYHKRIAAKYAGLDVATVYSQAQAFAFTTLRDALDQGDLLDQAHYDQVAEQISEFTGLSVETVKEKNLRVDHWFFFTHLLADADLTIGRYDSRFTAVALPSSTSSTYVDPSSSLTDFPFAAAINEYLRSDLNWQDASPYNIFGTVTGWPSDPSDKNTDMTMDLGQALSQNPDFRLMVASGYFDFACPMGTVDYELSQIPGGREFLPRITHTRYFGGHMMYINPSALSQLRADIVSFVAKATAPTKLR